MAPRGVAERPHLRRGRKSRRPRAIWPWLDPARPRDFGSPESGGTVSVDGSVVLVVDRDPDTRDRIGAWLEDAGLDVLVCPGPTAPEFTCVGSGEGRCPLARAADLV